MKYLLTFHVDQGRMGDSSPDEMKDAMERWNAFNNEAIEAGAMIACEALHDSSTATTIEVTEGGDRIATDGPFAESKEVVGGYAIVETKTREEAEAVANQFMELHRIHVPQFECECEVRPIEDY